MKYSEMLAQAKKEGVLNEKPAKGKYLLEVVGANHKPTKKGDPGFGIRFKVLTPGTEEGKSFWDNVYFSSESAQNVAISFETLARLGVTSDFFATEPAPEKVVERLLQIGKLEAEVDFVEKNGYVNAKFKNVKHLGQVDPSVPSLPAAPAAAAPPVAPAPAPPVAPGRAF